MCEADPNRSGGKAGGGKRLVPGAELLHANGHAGPKVPHLRDLALQVDPAGATARFGVDAHGEPRQVVFGVSRANRSQSRALKRSKPRRMPSSTFTGRVA